MAKLKDTSCGDYVNVPKNSCYDEMDMHNMGGNKKKLLQILVGKSSRKAQL